PLPKKRQSTLTSGLLYSAADCLLTTQVILDQVIYPTSLKPGCVGVQGSPNMGRDIIHFNPENPFELSKIESSDNHNVSKELNAETKPIDEDDDVVVLENSETEEEDIKEDESNHNKERYTFEDDDDDGEFDDLD
ncbi:hypothetical protein Tco_1022318, partial [Tanacetum coccineum]